MCGLDGCRVCAGGFTVWLVEHDRVVASRARREALAAVRERMNTARSLGPAVFESIARDLDGGVSA
jgi:hypothetical protein